MAQEPERPSISVEAPTHLGEPFARSRWHTGQAHGHVQLMNRCVDSQNMDEVADGQHVTLGLDALSAIAPVTAFTTAVAVSDTSGEADRLGQHARDRTDRAATVHLRRRPAASPASTRQRLGWQHGPPVCEAPPSHAVHRTDNGK